jgi:predicted nucleic acid-binding protein
MTYLLDNNVLSEWWKENPHPAVVAFLQRGGWAMPSPVIAEIQEGAETDPSPARRVQTNAHLDEFLRDYGDVLVVDFDAETARTWGRLRHTPDVKRKPQPLWDSLIDAMAVRYDYIVATRNTADFRHAKTFDPWSKT